LCRNGTEVLKERETGWSAGRSAAVDGKGGRMSVIRLRLLVEEVRPVEENSSLVHLSA